MQDSNQVTKHLIKHSYKPIIYVPYVAISNLYEFFMANSKKICKLADGNIYEVKDYKTLFDYECEVEIESIYHISFDLWLSKWLKVFPKMEIKTEFVRIELKEIND